MGFERPTMNDVWHVEIAHYLSNVDAREISLRLFLLLKIEHLMFIFDYFKNSMWANCKIIVTFKKKIRF